MIVALSAISKMEWQKFFKSLRDEELQTIRGLAVTISGRKKVLTNIHSRVSIIDELEHLFTDSIKTSKASK